MNRNIIMILILFFMTMSCEKKELNLTLTGSVKGLKKGTLYLQKIEDTLLVTIDSIQILGKGDFAFNTFIESPELLYLYLDKNDGNTLNDRIPFFAEPGTINIKTRFDQFDKNPTIDGSAIHNKYETFKGMLSKFDTKNFELIRDEIQAQNEENSQRLDSIDTAMKKLLKRRYLYAVNFAVTNGDSPIAPYVALSEVYDINVTYLDTIYNSLQPEIKKSKYGKQLDTYIKKIKRTEAPVTE